MTTQVKSIERITISLPATLWQEVETIRSDLKIPKSEIFKKAMRDFIRQYRRKKLQQAAEMMAEEYRTDKELTVFTALDSEDFK